jgi:hypothetical protein
MNTWLLRAVWLTLPVTAGDALATALRGWSTAPRVLAAVLLWVGWAVVLAATLVPRPVSATVARVGAPLALVLVGVATVAGDASATSTVVALAATLVATVLASRGGFLRDCAQGAAYGDEERFPLKVPPGVAVVLAPVAIVTVGTGLAAGPLLLADRRWVAGVVVTVVGLPAAALAARLLHQLSRRWVVLVPAGVVVADPLTLTDPVLFVRDRILGIGPADPSRRPPADALDLRLGAAFGSCALLLREDQPITCRRRGRAVGTTAHLVLVTPAGATALLARAGARRIPVRAE